MASLRVSRMVLDRCRTLLLYTRPKHKFPIFSINQPQYMAFIGQVPFLHHSTLSESVLQRFGISSSSFTQTAEKKTDTAESDTDVDGNMSVVDLIKRLMQTEDELKQKDREIEQMKDKVLKSFAETENVMDRTRRESDTSVKFAIQNFAKSLLDVADNLERASSVVKESFAKIDTSVDTDGAVPLLKTLLEGVKITEKQLAEVFKKSGVEKYDPRDEQFDPNRHNAVFQVPDPSKAPDTIAVVLKPGYTLHDRVIRPAEVGVTMAVDA